MPHSAEEEAATERGRPAWERRLGVGIAVATGVVVVVVAASKWSEWSALLSDARPAPLIAALGVGMLGQFLNTVIAHQSLRVARTPISLSSTYRIVTVGGLAKFIPGGVWQIGSQYGLGRSEGLGFRSSMLAWVEPTVFNITVGGSMALLAATTVGYDVPAVFLVVGALVGLALSTNLLRHKAYRIVRLIPRDHEAGPPFEAWATRFTLTLAVVATSAFGGLLVIDAFGLPSPGFSGSVAAFVGAWVLGVLVFPVPGGLGIREGALVLLLTPWLSTPEAVLVATASRLVGVAAELVGAVIGITLGRGLTDDGPSDNQQRAEV